MIEYNEVGDGERYGDFGGVDPPDFVVAQEKNAEEGAYCLSRPCITNPTHTQFWWEDEPQSPLERKK